MNVRKGQLQGVQHRLLVAERLGWGMENRRKCYFSAHANKSINEETVCPGRESTPLYSQ